MTDRPPRAPLTATLLLLLLAASLPALAEESHYNRIALSAEAEARIPNDILVVEMYAQLEGDDSAALSRRVNERVGKALALARRSTGVEAETLDYRVTPIYQKREQVGWRVRQAIRLTASDFQALAALTGQLQPLLNIQGMEYRVSASAREAARERLIDQAIAAFKGRADQAVRALGREGWRLVELRIDTGTTPSPMPRLRAMAAPVAMDAAPAIEAGRARVAVTVSGVVEARRPLR